MSTPAPTTPAFDPYVQTDAAVQEPPVRLLDALKKIGPGLILAGAIVGTGELIATTNVGATAGFALLWLVILSCVIKLFVQVELGRYTISSGDTTLAALRKLPGPGFVLPWWWAVMTAATQAQIAAMIGSIGQAMHIAVPGVGSLLGGSRPELPWAVVITASAALLLAVGSYKVVERGTTALVVIFTMMTIGCVLFLPWTGHGFSLSDLASGFSFHIPAGAIAAAFAMFGITGVGATELISYPYWCIEKGYARYTGPRKQTEDWLRRAKGWLRVMQLDAWVSMAVYTSATVAFFLLGAAVLHRETAGIGLPRNVAGMLQTLSSMYAPVLGATAAKWFIVIGAFAVLYSTLFAATAANCRTLVDLLAMHNIISIPDHAARRRWVGRLCVTLLVIDFFIFFTIPDPVGLVTIGGIAQALTLPMIGTVAVYLRYRRTDRRIAPGGLWDVFLWLSMLALFAAATYGLWDSWKKL